MGHNLGRDGTREPTGYHQGDPVSAFARIAVFGLYVLHRFQGELGRVQTDGTGAVRYATVRPEDSGQPGGSEAGRLVPLEPGLLQLLHRTYHYQREVRSALRRP